MNIKLTLGLILVLQAIQLLLIFNLLEVNSRQNALLSLSETSAVVINDQRGVMRVGEKPEQEPKKAEK